MINNKNVVSIITARGGSKSIPLKNIKLLDGRPLITYSLNEIFRSKYIDDTYVATENKKIAEISMNAGAAIIDLPEELTTDTTMSDIPLLYAVKKVKFDILVYLQCTSPLTSASDIDGGVELFISGNYDSVLSVTKEHMFLWDENGNPLNYDYKKRSRRQDLVETFKENGAFYINTRANVIRHENRLSGKIGLYKMPLFRSFQIDDMEDWDLLELLVKTSKKGVNGKYTK